VDHRDHGSKMVITLQDEWGALYSFDWEWDIRWRCWTIVAKPKGVFHD